MSGLSAAGLIVKTNDFIRWLNDSTASA